MYFRGRLAIRAARSVRTKEAGWAIWTDDLLGRGEEGRGKAPLPQEAREGAQVVGGAPDGRQNRPIVGEMRVCSKVSVAKF
jgi:hypothetical protein